MASTQTKVEVEADHDYEVNNHELGEETIEDIPIVEGKTSTPTTSTQEEAEVVYDDDDDEEEVVQVETEIKEENPESSSLISIEDAATATE